MSADILVPVFNLKDSIKSTIKNEAFDNLKIIGQEQDNKLLVCYDSVNHDGCNSTSIGIFDLSNNNFNKMICFKKVVNITQASINSSNTFIVYATKICCENGKTCNEITRYDLFLTKLSDDHCIYSEIVLKENVPRQIVAQFLYKKKTADFEKFLIFVHQDAITLMEVQTGNNDNLVIKLETLDIVVKCFIWAQWDTVNQTLFYIHYKSSSQNNDTSVKDTSNFLSTLSALQFNDDTPYESVLNIPLNLPLQFLQTSSNIYDDYPLPLSVHDSRFNVTVLTDDRGIVCICHHYLYQPVEDPLRRFKIDGNSSTVHLAYSVTLLHHGQVLHCTVPNIPWDEASQNKLIFILYKDDHLAVYSHGKFLHLLDIGPSHEPCNHMILNSSSVTENFFLTLKYPPNVSMLIDPFTFDILKLSVSKTFFINAYKDLEIGVENKLAIIHYLLIHQNDFETISELIAFDIEKSLSYPIQRTFSEVLIAGTYATISNSLPSDAMSLLKYLPLTTLNNICAIEFKINGHIVTLNQEPLWNPSVMILSPRQRICPTNIDIWSKLWNLISVTSVHRFKPTALTEKLMISFICYQPEALSRCSTPLSPSYAMSNTWAFAEMNCISNGKMKPHLPFHEIEKCTASKQEHIISINLRELSMHLVKNAVESPMQVHAVATRYVAAQLELSRLLCFFVTIGSGINVYSNKGFDLIKRLDSMKKKVLFYVLERFTLSINTLAYPLPQGFSSFLTYLGYKTLSFNSFIQYAQSNILQLQIDVLKEIVKDIGTCTDNELKMLRLLQLLPRSRTKRLLNQWNNSTSLTIRARDHSSSILSGLEYKSHVNRQTSNKCRGLSIFNTKDRMSPLDTFLELLTGKASLAELDFNLLIEATMVSSSDFLG